MTPQAPSKPIDDDIQTETDHIIHEFCEETVRRAAELAQSTNISVEDILEEAKLIMAPAVSRLKRHRKKTAWDIAMREGKHTVDTAIVKPVAGLGYQGQAGFDGQYLKEVKTNYDDPAKRAEYEQMATEENELEYLPSIQTLAARQKKLLRELDLLVSTKLFYREHLLRLNIGKAGCRSRDQSDCHGSSIELEHEWVHFQKLRAWRSFL